MKSFVKFKSVVHKPKLKNLGSPIIRAFVHG